LPLLSGQWGRSVGLPDGEPVAGRWSVDWCFDRVMATLIAVRTTKSAPAHRSAVDVDSSLITEAKIVEVITSVMARDGMLIQRRTVFSSAVAGCLSPR
jgi:hypothetical protein